MEQSRPIQHHVQLALAQRSGINCSNIGVVCDEDQQVTLTGTVHSDAARLAALEAARTVSGISVVKDALVVHASLTQPKTQVK